VGKLGPDMVSMLFALAVEELFHETKEAKGTNETTGTQVTKGTKDTKETKETKETSETDAEPSVEPSAEPSAERSAGSTDEQLKALGLPPMSRYLNALDSPQNRIHSLSLLTLFSLLLVGVGVVLFQASLLRCGLFALDARAVDARLNALRSFVVAQVSHRLRGSKGQLSFYRERVFKLLLICIFLY